MPHLDELTLLLADRALCGAGGLVFAVTLVRWARSGRWRDPLRQPEAPATAPTLIHIVGVFAFFWVVSVVLLGLSGIDSHAARIIGSHEWFVFNGLDGWSKLGTSVVMALILHRYPAFRSAPGSRVLRLEVMGIGVAAMLVILPIADLQLRTGQIVWRWLDPAARQPIHSALEALAGGDWGIWGTALLVVTAIVVAPLAEELFFRGLLLQTIWGYLGHAWLAIVLSGIAFGLIHNQQPQDVLPLVTMGVILGYVRVRYRSLVACILIHALFNARTIIFALLSPELVTAY